MNVESNIKNTNKQIIPTIEILPDNSHESNQLAFEPSLESYSEPNSSNGSYDEMPSSLRRNYSETYLDDLKTASGSSSESNSLDSSDKIDIQQAKTKIVSNSKKFWRR